MSRTTIGWALAAVAGLLLAAGLTLAVSELTSQHVGLYEESPTAGRELVVTAPARTSATPKAKPPRTTPTTTPPATATTPPPPATTTDDVGGSGDDDGGDSSGRGRGRGRSGESDDD